MGLFRLISPILFIFLLPGVIVFAAEEMKTRTFKVSPDFPNWRVDAEDKLDPPDHLPRALEILKAFGVDFPEGASAVFNAATSQLIVRNTAKNMDVVEDVVTMQSGRIPVQVYLTTKVLVFDPKMVGENLIPLFALGSANGKEPPVQDPLAPPIPTDFQAAPGGVMGLAGVLTSEQSNAWFQYLGGHATDEEAGSAEQKKKTAEYLAGLKAKKAAPKPVAILSMPSATLPNGRSTVVGRTRELVMPAGPGRETLKRKAGLSVSITPVIGPDGYTIDLTYVPRVGGPVAWQKSTKDDQDTKVPVFPEDVSSFENAVSTAVTIWDGQTVLFGGLAYLPDFVLHPEHQGEDAMLAKPYQILVVLSSRMIGPDGKGLTEEQRGRLKPADASLFVCEWAVKNMSLHDAVLELAELSKREDPKGKGCNLILRAPEAATARITLRLHDFTVREALVHLASAAGLGIKHENDNTYILTPK